VWLALSVKHAIVEVWVHLWRLTLFAPLDTTVQMLFKKFLVKLVIIVHQAHQYILFARLGCILQPLLVPPVTSVHLDIIAD